LNDDVAENLVEQGMIAAVLGIIKVWAQEAMDP
jgi:hypothetical protein